eukprot:scaffold164170_cov17-Tisochrysis_lutea.AAC.1
MDLKCTALATGSAGLDEGVGGEGCLQHKPEDIAGPSLCSKKQPLHMCFGMLKGEFVACAPCIRGLAVDWRLILGIVLHGMNSRAMSSVNKLLKVQK